MNTDTYDIDAKASENVNLQQIRPYLQKLLEDRFQLVVHREKKQEPAYDLLPLKSGLKIVPSTDGSCVTPDPRTPSSLLREHGRHPEPDRGLWGSDGSVRCNPVECSRSDGD